MGITSFILGMLTSLGACVGTFPLLGWTLWFVLPLALLGFIFACVAVFRKDGKGKLWGWLGLFINLGTLVYGIIRLMIGGGII